MHEIFDLKSIIEEGDLSKLKVLLDTKPNLVDKYILFGPENKNAVHPLHYACDCVFEYKIVEIVALEMVKTLLEAGADVNGKASTGKDTPLIAASSLYCDQIALHLLSVDNVNVEHKGTHRGTALHWAAWTGSYLVSEKLVDKGADLNCVDNEFGASPLHWAINGMLQTSNRNKREQIKIIELLLSKGANPLITDNNNKTIYEIAKTEGLESVLAMLLRF